MQSNHSYHLYKDKGTEVIEEMSHHPWSDQGDFISSYFIPAGQALKRRFLQDNVIIYFIIAVKLQKRRLYTDNYIS